MTRTLVTFYTSGGVAGLLAVWGAAYQPARTWAIIGIAGSALLSAGLLARWGSRLPRQWFHLPVGMATGLIALVAWLAPDGIDALALASIATFVAVDAFFFFKPRAALVQLSAATAVVTLALLVRGDVAVGTALALDAVMVAIGLVTRSLAQRASGASRDPLTGLANRRGFDDALQQLLEDATRTGQPLSVALLDLDHFKEINDSRGHEAGDDVLVGVGSTWRRMVPEAAVLARHGGDEFAVLLPNSPGPHALATVTAMSESVAIGVSAGVAQHAAGETAAQLMRRADAALYRAKAAGRGRSALDGHDTPSLAQDLQIALTHGHVHVHYQPLVDLHTGRMFGVEALARWTHPELGPVSPEQFIPLAETHGLINQLGNHVLDTALNELTQLRDQTGAQLVLGVNTSVAELTVPGYAARVAELLADTGWPPGHLVFEITESQLDTDSDTTSHTLQQLLDMGCTTAIDDFGVGYSSLSRLDVLPIEHLKFDTSFIATITTSPRRAQMLGSLIAMARGLHLGLVAEGVETEAQAELLRQLGCRYGQGWLYGRPTGVTELQDRIASGPTTAPPGMPSIPPITLPAPRTNGAAARR